MNIVFFMDRGTYSDEGTQDWQVGGEWPDGESVPRKGELVAVSVIALPGQFRNVEPGTRVQREMRVIEVCHTSPHNVQVYLVPTYVKVQG